MADLTRGLESTGLLLSRQDAVRSLARNLHIQFMFSPWTIAFRLTDSQSMVLFSGTRCDNEFCTQLAHWFVRAQGIAANWECFVFTS
jgi:hypothetical protein